MDTVVAANWNFWTFAWVRWFYVSGKAAKPDGGEDSTTSAMPTLKLSFEDCCAINADKYLNPNIVQVVGVHTLLNRRFPSAC